MIVCRVYIEGDYKEPDPGTLPALPSSLTHGLEMEMMYREERVSSNIGHPLITPALKSMPEQ